MEFFEYFGRILFPTIACVYSREITWLTKKKKNRSSNFAMHSRERISDALRARTDVGDTQVRRVKVSRAKRRYIFLYPWGATQRGIKGGPPTSQHEGGAPFPFPRQNLRSVRLDKRPPTGYLLFVIYMTRYASLSR